MKAARVYEFAVPVFAVPHVWFKQYAERGRFHATAVRAVEDCDFGGINNLVFFSNRKRGSSTGRRLDAYILVWIAFPNLLQPVERILILREGAPESLNQRRYVMAAPLIVYGEPLGKFRHVLHMTPRERIAELEIAWRRRTAPLAGLSPIQDRKLAARTVLSNCGALRHPWERPGS